MALIGLISDIHAAPAPVEAALSIFKQAGVDRVFCAGDIAGYMDQLDDTVSLLVENQFQTVIGNHDIKYLDKHIEEMDTQVSKYLKQLPRTFTTTIEGKSVYMVHAQPPDECHGGIKLLNKDGDVLEGRIEQWAENLKSFNYDVLVVGHTHQVFCEVIAGTLVINPGSSVFNNCCAILKLPEMEVEFHSLMNKEIEKTWNWGEHVIYGQSSIMGD